MKTRARLIRCSLAVFLVLPAVAPAQSGGKSPMPIRAKVDDVTDTRSTGSFRSECKLGLTFTGDAAADALRVRRVHVTKAEDELGRDLTPKRQEEASDFANASLWSNTMKAQITLRNPSRNAAVIKLIEGEVDLFNPSLTNGGILILKDILKHPAEPVENPILKQYGIQMMYLTRESYEAKQKQLEVQSKASPGDASGAAFGDLFQRRSSGMMWSDSKNALKLYVKDPDKRVVEVTFLDAAGKPLKRTGSWTSNELRTHDFDAPPPADAQLMIHLVTPEAIQSFPFKLENIPLP